MQEIYESHLLIVAPLFLVVINTPLQLVAESCMNGKIKNNIYLTENKNVNNVGFLQNKTTNFMFKFQQY